MFKLQVSSLKLIFSVIDTQTNIHNISYDFKLYCFK